jgi:hypothetical protein
VDFSVALIAENDAFAELLRDADLSTPVPTCPDWTLSQLMRHIGRGDRWCAHIVAEMSTEAVDPRDVAGGSPPEDRDGATAWLHGGARALIDAVDATGAQTPVITNHGGPAMQTPNVYLIWYGTWNQSNGSDNAAGQQLVRDFLFGLNNSPYYLINSSYATAGGTPTGGISLAAAPASHRQPDATLRGHVPGLGRRRRGCTHAERSHLPPHACVPNFHVSVAVRGRELRRGCRRRAHGDNRGRVPG